MGAVDEVLIFIINRIKYQKQCYVSPNCGSSGYFHFINHRSFQEPKPDFGIDRTNLTVQPDSPWTYAQVKVFRYGNINVTQFESTSSIITIHMYLAFYFFLTPKKPDIN